MWIPTQGLGRRALHAEPKYPDRSRSKVNAKAGGKTGVARLAPENGSRQGLGAVIFFAVTKLCIFVGTTVFGILGSVLAGAFGMDTFSLGSFLLSGVGSMVGVYAGWKFAQRFG